MRALSLRPSERLAPGVLFAVALVALAFASSPAHAAARPGDKLPEISLDQLTATGSAELKPTSIAAWAAGKPSLLLFALPGHRPSELEAADLRALASGLGGKLAVGLVTVPKGGITTATELRSALGEAAQGLAVFRDNGFALATAVGIGSAPTYVLADRDGTLRVVGAKALAAPVTPSGGTFADYLRGGISSGSFATLAELPVYKPNQRLVGRAFQELALPRIDVQGAGKLSDWAAKGKAVLLVFWSVRCPHCTKEMPHFASVVAKYAERLELVAVARTGDGAMEQETRQYLTSNNLGFPCLLDATGSAMDSYLVSSTPTSVLIRGDGTVLAVESGEIDNLTAWLDRHLGAAGS
ncbi:MAG: TlpA family protein disulfide reductase [Deltaproteobacteria bacterium]|nr:TlpA family protein disulfide reductase [Deltaproteobacteria bacterium]